MPQMSSDRSQSSVRGSEPLINGCRVKMSYDRPEALIHGSSTNDVREFGQSKIEVFRDQLVVFCDSPRSGSGKSLTGGAPVGDHRLISGILSG
jgi:hypothetical protein